MTLSCLHFLPFVWMAATVLHSIQAESDLRYPKINGSETLTCVCPDHTCQDVFWYRFLSRTNTLQFLMYVNSAGREVHGNELASSRFKGSVTPGSKVSYSLRAMGLQSDDTGLYSCMFKNKHFLPEGTYIMPGVNLPTVHPPTVRTERTSNPVCHVCKTTKKAGCKSSVLWPGVGVLLLLAVTLAGTLYYFSRLPKKCRHQFTKKNPWR